MAIVANFTKLDVLDNISCAKFNNCFLFLFQKTENHRVCFGKSGIHGWGLFARRNFQEGEMVLNELVVSYINVFLPMYSHMDLFLI